MAAPRARFLVILALAGILWAARAQEHAIPLALSTPRPTMADAVVGGNIDLAIREPLAKSLRAAPCMPFTGGIAHSVDNALPAFLLSIRAAKPSRYLADAHCKPQRLQRRRDSTKDSPKIWGIVLGIAFGLVFLATAACCTCCCCFPKRLRERQARLHQRERDPEDGTSHPARLLELPAYRPRAPDGELQLEEAPAPDYHAHHPHHVAPGYHEPHHNGQAARPATDVPLPPSPGAPSPPPAASLSMPLPQHPASAHLPPPPPAHSASPSPAPPPATSPRAAHFPPAAHIPPSSPPPPTDLPPAYSHAHP